MANEANAALDRQPGTNGIWTFVFIDMIMFTLIFLVFLSEKWRLPDVYEQGQAHLDFRFGLANTLLLITSSFFMAQAVGAARLGNAAAIRRFLAACIACGLAFCVNKLFEYRTEIAAGFGPSKDSFFSFYYFMTGAHFLHVLGGLIFIFHCLAVARAETGQASYVRKLENTGLFWHFVDLLWMFIFPLLYLAKEG